MNCELVEGSELGETSTCFLTEPRELSAAHSAQYRMVSRAAVRIVSASGR